MTRAIGTAALLAVLSCSRSSEPPRAPAAAPGVAATPQPDATPPASGEQPVASSPVSQASAPPSPTGPIPLPVTTVVARAGESASPLSFNEPTVVDTEARFHVETAVALADARLSLVDAEDAIVAAVVSHEIGSTWTRFTLVPDAPLRPGTRYTLRLDGAADREAHDSSGRAYQVAAWPVRVAGDPPPPPARAKAGRTR